MQLDRFTTKSQEALQAAVGLAASRRNTEVQPEHLLAVLLEQGEGVIPPVLRKVGTSPDEIRRVVNAALDALPRHDVLAAAVEEVRGSHRVTSQNPEDTFEALEKFGRDLTEEAREGKLDPVIGRDDEIRRVIQ